MTLAILIGNYKLVLLTQAPNSTTRICFVERRNGRNGIRTLPRRTIKPSCGETWRALFTKPYFACSLAKFSQSFLLPCFLLAYLFICSLCLVSFFPPRLLIVFLLYPVKHDSSLLSSFITQTRARFLLNNLLTEETQRLGMAIQLYGPTQPIVIR
jgi:hypothetical protein